MDVIDIDKDKEFAASSFANNKVYTLYNIETLKTNKTLKTYRL